MPADVKRQGNYKLLKTSHGHRILDLNDGAFYAWVEGQYGEILVQTDKDHEFVETLQEGEFRYVDFTDDPEYTDMPHLFLQEKNKYREIVLPNGLPTDKDHQKKLVDTGKRVSKHEVDKYLKHPAPAGEGDNRRQRERDRNEPGMPIDDYPAKTVREIKNAIKDLPEDELKKVKEHEESHKDRKTAMAAINRQLKKKAG